MPKPKELTLIQTRIPAKQAAALDKLQQKAGVLTRAEYVRQILLQHVDENKGRK